MNTTPSQTPDDFDPIDFELWRLECAMEDAAPLVDEPTRAALVVIRKHIHDQREARTKGPAR